MGHKVNQRGFPFWLSRHESIACPRQNSDLDPTERRRRPARSPRDCSPALLAMAVMFALKFAWR